MSIVRYVNKKTGKVALYESTSHYDPIINKTVPAHPEIPRHRGPGDRRPYPVIGKTWEAEGIRKQRRWNKAENENGLQAPC